MKKKKVPVKPKGRYLLRKLLDSNDVASSKRFVTLIISAHFIIASFVILFKITNISNNVLLEKVLEYDFWIILAGLGFITSENLTNALIENARAKAMSIMNQNNPYGGYGGLGQNLDPNSGNIDTEVSNEVPFEPETPNK